MLELDERGRTLAHTLFRVMLSGIFLVAATNHLMRPGHIAGRLEQAPLGYLATWMASPEVLVVLAGGALLLGGLGLLVGFKTRWAALGLFAVVVPITLTVQVGRISTLGPLFKNIGLMGGLLYFATHGARGWSMDRFSQASGGAGRVAGMSAILLVAGLGLAGCASANAAGGGSAPSAGSAEVQAADQADTRVVFGVRKPKHIKVAAMTAHQMLAGEARQPASRVDIVTCGPAIRALAEDSKLAGVVRKALEAGIRIKACGVTVEKMGFPAERFIDGVEVVPNGFTEIVRLQAIGFESVEL